MTRLILAGLVGSLLAASGASAQQPGPGAADTAGRQMHGPGMGRGMMMADSMDARLDTLVRAMNRATGTGKVQAMAAVINELVAQRKAMRAHMHEMMESDGMMRRQGEGRRGGHMMQDMQKSPADSAEAKMSEPDTVDHSQHH